MSTAARSPWATPLARAARGSSRRCSTSWTGARAATGSRRCAWAVAAPWRPRSSASPDRTTRGGALMTDDTASISLELSPNEFQLVRTALRLLLSSLGREEADELEDVRALLQRIEQIAAA